MGLSAPDFKDDVLSVCEEMPSRRAIREFRHAARALSRPQAS
jgi:hypothetical protein